MAREFIWQNRLWPDFTYDREAVGAPLRSALVAQATVVGALLGLSESTRAELETTARTDDAIDTSAIEGELLRPESARSSILRRLSPTGIHPRTTPDAESIAAVTIDATQRAARRISAERLIRWNRILLRKADAGFRAPGPDMVVQSGPIGRERVHLVAPPSDRLDWEISRFVEWTRLTSFDDDGLIVAAKTHLWFVTIHPFEDGNGRIARALADLMLARAYPSVSRYISMTRQIARERSDYYTILEKTQRGDLNVTDWLSWFLSCYERACRATLSVIDAALFAGHVLVRASTLGVNERQSAVLHRLLDDFDGKLTAKKYQTFAGNISTDTAQRDIADLVAKNILTKSGSTKNATYMLVDPRTAN